MKSKNIILIGICYLSLLSFNGFASNIKLTIGNPENTVDGGETYFEADIMIQTINSQSDFKLGSGQLYLKYNTNAFGASAVSTSAFETFIDDGTEYFLGETDISGFGTIDFYNNFSNTDNSSSVVSWSFDQGVSSGAMTNLVGVTPRKLVHIKFKYDNPSMEPNIAFEDNESLINNARDQFYTACGPHSSPTTSVDCNGANEGVQFFDAIFESQGATLSAPLDITLSNFNVYPNPTKGLLNIDINKASSYALVDMLGRVVESGAFKAGNNEMYLRDYDSGVYFIKIEKEGKTYSKRIILD